MPGHEILLPCKLPPFYFFFLILYGFDAFCRFNSQENVCGLCGNYDGNANNDFTTRSQEQVIDPLHFGNSWKVSTSCPESLVVQNPCANNPYRQAWAQKQCSIINSDTFAACHSKVLSPLQTQSLFPFYFLSVQVMDVGVQASTQ